MGMCGCSELDIVGKFPGPTGVTYTVGVYRGCLECGAGAFVSIDRHEGEVEMWAGDPPEIEFVEEIGFTVPMLNPEILERALREMLDITVDDFIKSALVEVLRDSGRPSDAS